MLFFLAICFLAICQEEMKKQNKKTLFFVFSMCMILLVGTLGVVSAQKEAIVFTDEEAGVNLVITFESYEDIGFLENLINSIQNLFVIGLQKSVLERGEQLVWDSGLSINSCSDTSVKFTITSSSGSTKYSKTVDVGSISFLSAQVTHQASTSTFSEGTYTLRDRWLCGSSLITSAFGEPNPSTATFTIIEQTSTCVEDWISGLWGQCPLGIQYRQVTDINNCGTTFDKPITSRSCEIPDGVNEEWKASESFTLKNIQSSPAESLAKGICNQASQCKSDSNCVSIDNFVNNDDISDSRADVLREKFCQNEVSEEGFFTFKAFTDNDFFNTCKAFTGKTKYFRNNYGFCIFEGETESFQFLKSIGEKFPITDDPLTNGIIIVFGFSLIIIFFFSGGSNKKR